MAARSGATWLRSLGARPGESANEQLGRQILVLGGVLMSGGGVLWGALCLGFGLPGPAVVPLGYVALTAVNLAVLAQTRAFPRARVAQVLLSLALPFLFQWSLGGFVHSGGVMLWAMIALVGSLTFSSARESIGWLAVYVALTVLSGVLDARLAAEAPFTPTAATVRLFFVVNVSVISAIVFSLAIALNQRQRTAIDALEHGERTKAELAGQLQVAVEQLQGLTAGLEAQVHARTAELEAALVHAEAGTRAKGDFLAMMSHEIRTPLNGIIGTAELLGLSALDAEQRDNVEVVRRSGELLLSIINDVLDFSKIEAGKLELAPRPCVLCDELDAVLRLHTARASERGVRLTLDCGPGVPHAVTIDPDRLAQVVGNLLSNAVKFTHEGAITLTVRGDARRLFFEVRDTGIGIPADVLPRLFNPFTQADSSTTRRYGGTGLGLAICARLIAALGGHIDVESAPGQGTTFRFDVAVQPAEVPALPAPANDLPGPAFALRVLLAEDNPVNQTIGARLLRSLGCTVAVVGDGAEALSALAQAPFDLVLMDVQMPVLDGLEATRRLRATSGLTQVRVVALTANAFESDRQACLEAGMDDFITKPLKLDALRAQLERARAALVRAA